MRIRNNAKIIIAIPNFCFAETDSLTLIISELFLEVDSVTLVTLILALSKSLVNKAIISLSNSISLSANNA